MPAAVTESSELRLTYLGLRSKAGRYGATLWPAWVHWGKRVVPQADEALKYGLGPISKTLDGEIPPHNVFRQTFLLHVDLRHNRVYAPLATGVAGFRLYLVELAFVLCRNPAPV